MGHMLAHLNKYVWILLLLLYEEFYPTHNFHDFGHVRGFASRWVCLEDIYKTLEDWVSSEILVNLFDINGLLTFWIG
jgi:hypothetical protein